MSRENVRFKSTPRGLVQFTEAEEVARDAEEQEWADGANDRLAATHRETRNELLAASDWTQLPDSPLPSDKSLSDYLPEGVSEATATVEQLAQAQQDLLNEAKTSWATYRSSLRLLPEHENWPSLEDADWPTKPS